MNCPGWDEAVREGRILVVILLTSPKWSIMTTKNILRNPRVCTEKQAGFAGSAQTLLDATPHTGNIYLFSKIAVTIKETV